MRENKSKTESVWSDLYPWFKAIIHHWVTSAGCALVAVFQICYGIWRHDWPPGLSWAILAACFVWATFLAWRDEHRKTIDKERRSILNKIVELREGVIKPDPLGALIKVSDELVAKKTSSGCVSSLMNRATAILLLLSAAAPCSSRGLTVSDLSFFKMRGLPKFAP
jgi:hypothetical protein